MCRWDVACGRINYHDEQGRSQSEPTRWRGTAQGNGNDNNHKQSRDSKQAAQRAGRRRRSREQHARLDHALHRGVEGRRARVQVVQGLAFAAVVGVLVHHLNKLGDPAVVVA